jgi:hydrogenase/urease accessory protein HupE
MPARHFGALLSLVLVFLSLTGTGAYAHDARPLYLDIKQQGAGRYHATLAVPSSVAADNQPEVHWPASCELISRSRSSTGMAYRTHTYLHCRGGLDGKFIGFRYPLYNPSLATVIRVAVADGRAKVTVLSPDKTGWTVPQRPSWWSVALEYLRLGIEHILGGIDHLLFVAGLVLLARTLKRVIIVVTGFTIAHSLTLSLAALQLINVPVTPTEAAIALSILFLAGEIARAREDSLALRYPLLISSTFGLLHGLGFAAALRTIGLPPAEITSALLCFNAGVEIGQIAFILCLLGIYRVLSLTHTTTPVSWGHLRTVGGYVLGIPAAFWFLQRLAQF